MIARTRRRSRRSHSARTDSPRRLTILLLGLVLLLAPCAAALAVPAPPAAAQGASLPPLPRGWPGTLQLGLFDGAGGAAAMQADTRYGFRYAYLAGGVNTGGGWANWNPDGRFATYWIQDSAAHGIAPVFTYYMLVQSRPGGGNEGDANFANLQNRDTMISYYQDLRLLLQRSGEFPNQTVVVHFEPDLWGFMEQRASGDNAATIPAQVAATGLPELAGLPNSVAGFAQAAARLRDTYAPNVILAYHQSVWGTGNDIQYSNPPDAEVDALATRAGAFYNSLGAGFDVIFNDFSDRDAGFKQYVYGDGGASFWDAGDFARHLRFLSRLVSVTGKRVALWQIPFGNTKMRAMNNTWDHYQDNRVEWLLDDPGRGHLNAYVQAGAVGFLFGRGADGTTCPCDANNDGVTNPAPINGNTATSLSADDDGGYFRQQARAYYAAGALPLPGGGAAPPTPTGIPTATATATAAATASATAGAPSATPGGALAFTAAATAEPGAVAPGGSVTLNIRVTSATAGEALIDVELYGPNGLALQRVLDGQGFAAGQTRTFPVVWDVPDAAPLGSYVVKIGVFSPGWGTLHTWNNDAVRVTVQDGPGPPATAVPPTATRTPAPTATRTPAPSATPAPPTATNTPPPTATNTPPPTATNTPGASATTATPGYTISGGASPGTLAPGGSVALTAQVTSRTAGSALIDLEVYGPSGERVFQAYHDGQAFAAGQRREFGDAWTVPANAPAGIYTLKVGVFSPGWGKLYSWSNQAAQFRVNR